jgi:parallel beta-helix repeat protein
MALAFALSGVLTPFAARPLAATTSLISGCPYRITAPGTYVLTRDLTCPPFTAIEVAADGVTLILGPYTIDGQGTSTTGVFTSGSRTVRDLLIVGGNLVRYGTGVLLDRSPGARIVGVSASRGLVGIFLGHCAGCEVIRNRMVGNEVGIVVNVSDARVLDNKVNDNAEDGIVVVSGAKRVQLIGNAAFGNGTDLTDLNAACVNTWRANRFKTDSEGDGRAGGCIR